MKSLSACLVSLLLTTVATAQVHLTFVVPNNGTQYQIDSPSSWETWVSVPRTKPGAHVWLAVQAEQSNVSFDGVQMSLDCGPSGGPYANPWTGWPPTIWQYTPFPTSWYYQRTNYPLGPEVLVRTTTFPRQTMPLRGDSRTLGLVRFQVPPVPGTYRVRMLGSEYPYWPTAVTLRGAPLVTRYQELVIQVRP